MTLVLRPAARIAAMVLSICGIVVVIKEQIPTRAALLSLMACTIISGSRPYQVDDFVAIVFK